MTTPVDPGCLAPVLVALGLADRPVVGRFVDRGFGKEYDAYLVDGTPRLVVKADDGEGSVYERWLSGQADLPIPRLLATALVEDRLWHTFEERGGSDLQVVTTETVREAGRSVARLHARFWSEPSQACANDSRAERYSLVIGRLPALSEAFEELRDRVVTAPSTLCENDLLPMNVLWDGHSAIIIDFGHAGIGPYFCDPARFVAFGNPEGTYYVQSRDAREHFLSRYFADLAALTGTRLSRQRFERDIALGEIGEIALPIAGHLRAGGDETDAAILPEVERVLQLAEDLR